MWADALALRFFSPAFEGETVTLAVDRQALASTSQIDPDHAVEALAKVVRALVMPNHRFSRVTVLADRWRSGGCDGPPPSLPLLGLTVLAASEMVKFDFYRPFRQLLDPTDTDGGMPGDFDEVIPALWAQLRWWLDTHLGGACGVSTIENHPTFTNIGWSLGQAVFRESDRAHLYRFFRAIRLEPVSDTAVAAELRRALAIWSARQGDAVSRLHRLATDPDLEPIADRILVQSATSWDGRLCDPVTGSRAASLKVLLELRPVSVGIAAPRQDDDPRHVTVTCGEQAVGLAGDGAWFEPAPLAIPDVGKAITHGLVLTGRTLSYFLEPAEAYALRFEYDLAAWTSVSRMTFGEKHHLLVAQKHRAAVEAWLSDERIEGQLDPLATPKLPSGWFLFRGVRLESAPPSAGLPRALLPLMPTSGSPGVLRLVGGLRLPAMGRGIYLTGGVPNVAFPQWEHGEHTFELRAKGHDPLTRTTAEPEFELRQFFNLGPGTYELSCQGSTLSFELVASVRERFADPEPLVRSAGPDGRTARGYLVDGPSPTPPCTVPASEKGTIVLGSSPDRISNVVVPRWFTDVAGLLDWVALDAWDINGSPPVWALSIDLAGRRVAFLLDPRPPDGPAQGDPLWARAIRIATLAPHQGTDTERLWASYVEAAGPGR